MPLAAPQEVWLGTLWVDAFCRARARLHNSERKGKPDVGRISCKQSEIQFNEPSWTMRVGRVKMKPFTYNDASSWVQAPDLTQLASQSKEFFISLPLYEYSVPLLPIITV
jgi:hypothetical protein